MRVAFDSREFRRILGHYPTGVCAITAVSDGRPVGMVVGSFTSISLDPPLVAFLPDRKSTTWAAIQAAGRFCVNVPVRPAAGRVPGAVLQGRGQATERYASRSSKAPGSMRS